MSEVQIVPPDLNNKFNTCRHRSQEKMTRIIKRCSCQGGNYTEEGFYCNRRSIFKIDQHFCQSCDQFEHK